MLPPGTPLGRTPQPSLWLWASQYWSSRPHRSRRSSRHPSQGQAEHRQTAHPLGCQDYGYDIVHRSPQYKTQRNGNKVVLHFEHVGGGLDTFDVRTPIGFTLAGNDEVFHPAKAKIVGKDRIEVWSDAVPNPIAARYAWADNPVCNVQNREGLPLTPSYGRIQDGHGWSVVFLFRSTTSVKLTFCFLLLGSLLLGQRTNLNG